MSDTTKKKIVYFVFLNLFIATIASQAAEQKYSAEEMNRKIIEQRAFEAVVWGVPAVNTDLMLQEMLTKTQGQVNQILYWSRPGDWKNQTLTPNPDAIYFMLFYNTKDVGPLVIEVPPADTGSLAANFCTLWQMPMEDAGPNGADQGKGGKYLILTPGGFKDDKPPAGYFILKSDTYSGFALLRSNLKSHSEADISAAIAYGKRMKVYPLKQAANPPQTIFTDANGVLYDSTIRYDLSFFQLLNRIVQNEPWLTRDLAMIDQLKSIGIEKGKPFNPDAKTQEILKSAIGQAQAWLEHRYDTDGIPAWWPTSKWGNPAVPEFAKATQSGYTEPNLYPIDIRGMIYTFGFVGIKRLGTAQFYLITIKDKDGQPFHGGSNYKLNVPANPPVKLYWSATAYDRVTHALIRNMSRASRASNSTEVQKNADGSVDIYFGTKAPAGKENNWVPTDPNRDFEVMFRFYSPEKPLFDKTWKLNDIEKMK